MTAPQAVALPTENAPTTLQHKSVLVCCPVSPISDKCAGSKKSALTHTFIGVELAVQSRRQSRWIAQLILGRSLQKSIFCDLIFLLFSSQRQTHQAMPKGTVNPIIFRSGTSIEILKEQLISSLSTDMA